MNVSQRMGGARKRQLTGAVLAAAGVAAFAYSAASQVSAQAAPPARFTEHVIQGAVPGGYQVVAVDLNKDGKLDLLALGFNRNNKELVWYENPSWERHVLSDQFNNMINAAAYDLDGDGIPEIALAHGFATTYENSPGGIELLTHGADPKQPWTAKHIDNLPTSHRVRWANVDGGKKVVLVNSPLITEGSTAPDYRKPNLLAYYEAPDWKRQTMYDFTEGLQHGVLPTTAFTGTKVETVLSAGFMGIFESKWQGGKFVTTKLTSGSPDAWPKSGSSDIVVGKVGGAQFIGAIEPWHGNEVVVYQKDGAAWGKRQVLDNEITDGHALVVGDFGGTGNDAIVAGERGGKRSVYIYWPPAKLGEPWTKQVLDPAMAASGCWAADLNGDRRPDIACIQGAGNAVKWYENMGK